MKKQSGKMFVKKHLGTRGLIRGFLCFMMMFFVSGQLFAKSYYNDFEKAFTNRNIAKVEKILKKWEKESPTDLELYFAYFNYYLSKAKSEKMAAVTTPSGKNVNVRISDYDDELLNKALSYTEKILEQYPNRLDVFTGYVDVYSKKRSYDKLLETLERMLKISKEYGNKWLWRCGEYEGDGMENLLDVYNSVFATLYERPKTEEYIKTFIDISMQYYPTNYWVLYCVGNSYIRLKDFPKALTCFEKSVEDNPECYESLINLGFYYETEDVNLEKALEYFKLVTKSPNENLANFAKEKILELEQSLRIGK